jgi:hypothetical protein
MGAASDMGLNTVREIERAIDALEPEQVEELYLWMDHRQSQMVDARIATSLDNGVFDERIDRAMADYQEGKTSPLRRS